MTYTMMHKVRIIFTAFVTLIGLTCYVLPLQATDQKNTKSKTNILDANRSASKWAISIIGLGKIHCGFDRNPGCYSAILGPEKGVGIGTEFKLSHAFRIQIGLMYSYLTAGMVTWRQATSTSQSLNRVGDLQVVKINRHAFSLPLYFRLYPVDSASFALFISIRPIWVTYAREGNVWNSEDIKKELVYDNQQIIRHASSTKDLADFLTKDLLKLISTKFNNIVNKILSINTVFQGVPSRKVANPARMYRIELGFDYKSKSGWMIGMHGAGLTLGYDFTRHIIK